MIRVFLDANVLFSASNVGGNIVRLVHLLIEREEAVTSDFAAEEARRNVQLKRQSWAENLDALLRQVRVVPSIQFDLPVKLSDKDQPILCTAIRCGCQYLVTGDKKDFGHLYDRSIEGVTIITLTRLAKIMMQARKNVERL